MPTHLYHLKLELYPHPNSDTGAKDSRSRNIYVPPADTNIFGSSLPIHRSTPRTKDFSHKRAKPSLTSDSLSRTPESRPTSAGHLDTPGDALLLPERNTALKESPVQLPSSPKPSSAHATKDWRFGPVCIESIDMEASRETKDASGAAAKGPSGSHTRAVYVPSETKATDVGWGVVHLYKDSQEAPDLTTSTKKSLAAKGEDGVFDIEKCSTLCILAVPSWMMPSDLLGFVGDQTREDVSHFRLIRTGRANKYMVLMKFRSPKKARDWQSAWNGRLFSAMEPENCHVVFISTVTFLTPNTTTSNDPPTFPLNTTDPFITPFPAPITSKPYAPPTPSLIELPTCPVCLERMDETTGLLTILCQHVFHCACLEKWRGSGCPVCRFSQSPSSTFPYPRPSSDSTSTSAALSDPACSVCASSSNLWICLICGNIGCGRYDDAHAYAHWEETSHCYAMDISSQHVWDYAGDGYVHRLIQNKEMMTGAGGSRHESRFIDVGGRRGGAHQQHPNEAYRAEGEDSVPREKMEAMANEYTYLLTNQLESQRRYFEEQVERAVDKASSAGLRAEEAARRLGEMEGRVGAVEEERDRLRGEVEALGKRLEKASVRGERFEGLARSSMSQVREEKTINDGLLARIKAMEAEVGRKREEEAKWKGEIEELKELNRDLTMFVEGREKLRQMEAEEGLEVGEVEGGKVEVGEKSKRKGKGRKK
ncbi:RING finger protein ETP1 [Elsinoe australis]|uniref:RING finger protein ETP1 n=1 Tax=Elsinoe australis TaxID=40998 RepID=A0A2P8AJ26_9PEZI|nr:RING finger protein ETP1 [Elsinoe australis]